jgi:hypothetical protein
MKIWVSILTKHRCSRPRYGSFEQTCISEENFSIDNSGSDGTHFIQG